MKQSYWMLLIALMLVLATNLVVACGDDDDDDDDDSSSMTPCEEYYMDCFEQTASEAEASCETYYDFEDDCPIEAADDLFDCVDSCDAEVWELCAEDYANAC